MNYQTGPIGVNYSGCSQQSTASSLTEKNEMRAGARSNVIFGRGGKPHGVFFSFYVGEIITTRMRLIVGTYFEPS